MENAIYFSKIEYREVIGYGNTASVILLDIPERELSYQVFDRKKQMPAIEGKWNENGCSYGITDPVKKIRNAKTGFEPQMVREEAYHREVVFSYAIKLNEPQMKALLPYCNALDFEPYRDRRMNMDDEGYIGYRDVVHLYFTATTDSYIPLLKLPMNYYYDEEHIWPSEKLYQYLVKKFLPAIENFVDGDQSMVRDRCLFDNIKKGYGANHTPIW